VSQHLFAAREVVDKDTLFTVKVLLGGNKGTRQPAFKAAMKLHPSRVHHTTAAVIIMIINQKSLIIIHPSSIIKHEPSNISQQSSIVNHQT